MGAGPIVLIERNEKAYEMRCLVVSSIDLDPSWLAGKHFQ
jgi:hypothetical protein